MCTKFRELVDASSKDPKTMEEITEILDVMLTDMEVEHPKLYWETINDIYVLVKGMIFDEQTAKYAVSCFDNEDGTKGEHWTLTDTTSVANSVGVVFDKDITQYDWYFVMNMMYSDFYKVFGSDTNMYAQISKAWINDKDGGKHRAFRYWRMIKGY